MDTKICGKCKMAKFNERVVFSKGEARIESLGAELRTLLKNADSPLNAVIDINRLWDDGLDFWVDFSDGVMKYIGRLR